MDSFEVLITPDAIDMLNNLCDYIMIEKQNPEAADDIYRDAIDTADKLETMAGSLEICQRKILADNGYHKILFQRHKYILIYKIYGKTAVVEAVFHQKEDYENKLTRKLHL